LSEAPAIPVARQRPRWDCGDRNESTGIR